MICAVISPTRCAASGRANLFFRQMMPSRVLSRKSDTVNLSAAGKPSVALVSTIQAAAVRPTWVTKDWIGLRLLKRMDV